MLAVRARFAMSVCVYVYARRQTCFLNDVKFSNSMRSVERIPLDGRFSEDALLLSTLACYLAMCFSYTYTQRTLVRHAGTFFTRSLSNCHGYFGCTQFILFLAKFLLHLVCVCVCYHFFHVHWLFYFEQTDVHSNNFTPASHHECTCLIP